MHGYRVWAIVAALSTLPATAFAQNTGPGGIAVGEEVAVSEWFLFGIPILTVIVALFYVSKILATIGRRDSSWSLAHALSEKKVLVREHDVGGQVVPVLGADGKPVVDAEYTASSSRLIAFMGTIVVLIMFAGFGLFAMVRFGLGADLSGLDHVAKYLLAGLGFFAPYAVNKITDVVKKEPGQ